MAYTTGTLTGTYVRPNGVARTGTVVITPSTVVRDEDGNEIVSGSVSIDLVAGAFSVELVATDDDTLDPTGVTYKVSGHGALRGIPTTTGVSIETGETTDMADVTPVDPEAPVYALQVTRAEFDALEAAVEAGGGAVDSVNGDVGVVVLDAGDVGADPAGTASGLLATHTADTTAVHGIADTSVLETTTGAQTKATAAQSAAISAAATDATTKANAAQSAATTAAATDATTKANAAASAAASALSSHEADTTNVHGIANTANLETTSGAQSKADAAQAFAIQRGNHTGFQTASTISDFAEVARDTIGLASVGAGGVIVTVNDAGDEITWSVNGLTIAQTTGLQAALDAETARATAAEINALGLHRLDTIGLAALRRLGGQSVIDHAESTISTVDWDNISDAIASNNVAVSGNKLFATSATQPAAAYVTLGTAITPGEKFRAVSFFDMVALGGSSAIYFGMSTRAVGSAAAPVSTYADDLCIGITTTGQISHVKGANITGFTAPSNATPWTVTSGRYIVAVDGDETNVSFSIRKADDYTKTHTWRVSVATLIASGETFGQLVFSIADSRTTSGHSAGPAIVTRASQQTPRTKAVASMSLEGVAHRDFAHVAVSSADNWRTQIPASYDPRRPAPVCLYFHQSQSSTTAVDRPWVNANERPITKALGDAGYIVAAAQDGFVVGSNNDRYGNATSLANWLDYYQYLRSHFAIGPVVLWGLSAGVWPAMNLLARRTIPDIAAVYLHGGGFDLAGVRAVGGTYATAVDAAYGATDQATFDAATVNYNPILRKPWEFRGVPIRCSVVTDDAFGSPAVAVDPFLATLAPYVPEASKMTTATGGHLAAASFSSSDVMTFFNTYV